jgi:hypothetical protein
MSRTQLTLSNIDTFIQYEEFPKLGLYALTYSKQSGGLKGVNATLATYSEKNGLLPYIHGIPEWVENTPDHEIKMTLLEEL